MAKTVAMRRKMRRGRRYRKKLRLPKNLTSKDSIIT